MRREAELKIQESKVLLISPLACRHTSTLAWLGSLVLEIVNSEVGGGGSFQPVRGKRGDAAVLVEGGGTNRYTDARTHKQALTHTHAEEHSHAAAKYAACFYGLCHLVFLHLGDLVVFCTNQSGVRCKCNRILFYFILFF